MGRYTVAKDIAASPTVEIINPMVTALFPVMSKYRSDPAQLKRLYLRMLGWSAIICASTSVGVTMVADDFVAVILGSKWLDATPLVGWLALNAGMAALLSGTATLLDVLGMPYIGARIQWSRFIVFAVIIFAVAHISHSVIIVAIARLAVTTVFVPTIILAVRRLTGVPARDYLRAMWRPFLAAGFMALAIWTLNKMLPFHGAARLGLDMLAGTISYIAAVLALWELSGRPESAEQDILTLISKVQSRITRVGVLPETAD
jgi:PST family polysaccharide transporter